MKKLIFLCLLLSGCSQYNVGDCLVLQGSDNIYKVMEVGKYGLKTIKPRYDGYEVILLDPYDLKRATRMDCFDMFKTGPIGE